MLTQEHGDIRECTVRLNWFKNEESLSEATSKERIKRAFRSELFNLVNAGQFPLSRIDDAEVVSYEYISDCNFEGEWRGPFAEYRYRVRFQLK